MKKYELFKESLKEDIVVNKKEYLLIIAVCILGGILAGIIFSPKKSMTIGSFNGNGCQIPDMDETAEETEEDTNC